MIQTQPEHEFLFPSIHATSEIEWKKAMLANNFKMWETIGRNTFYYFRKQYDIGNTMSECS